MTQEINERNAKALADAVRADRIEIGKNTETIKQLNQTVNQLQMTVKALEAEVLVLKVSNMGSGPTG